jgi:hypothetical protein
MKSPQKSAESGDGGNGEEGDQEDFERFGLMAAFVKRWTRRLPQALALGAGEHVQIPPGNPDLITILEPYEK